MKQKNNRMQRAYALCIENMEKYFLCKELKEGEGRWFLPKKKTR